MPRLMVMALMTMVASAGLAGAQERPAPDPRGPTDASLRSVSVALDQTTAAQQKPPKPPPPPPPLPLERPRLGSMVGYIENPVLESKIRIRFDSGFRNEFPDRAEFFYAKCGCYRQDEIRDNPDPAVRAVYDPDAGGPGPGAASDLNHQQLYLEGEYVLTRRVSALVELPFRWIQPKDFAPEPPGRFGNQGGLGDLRAGVKVALLATPEQAVTVQLRTFFPTGESRDGLGTGHASIEPALLVYHRLSERLAIEGQIGNWLPLGGSAGVPIESGDKFSGNVLFYGIGPSYEVYRSSRVVVAPVVELVGWRVNGGFQTGTPDPDAGGTNIVNLKFGARIGWDVRNSLYVGYGHALTSEDWYDNILRLEYRYSF